MTADKQPAAGKRLATAAVDGSILPFPPTPSGSTAGLTMQDSVCKKQVEPTRLQPGAALALVAEAGYPDVPTGAAGWYELNLDEYKAGITRNPEGFRIRHEQGAQYVYRESPALCIPRC